VGKYKAKEEKQTTHLKRAKPSQAGEHTVCTIQHGMKKKMKRKKRGDYFDQLNPMKCKPE